MLLLHPQDHVLIELVEVLELRLMFRPQLAHFFCLLTQTVLATSFKIEQDVLVLLFNFVNLFFKVSDAFRSFLLLLLH